MKRKIKRVGSVLLFLLLPLILGVSCGGTKLLEGIPTSTVSLERPAPAQIQPADQGVTLRAEAAPIPPILTHYLIEVSIDHNQGTYQGRMLIDYTNDATEPLASLYFRLYPNAGSVYGDGWLTVTGASVEGSPAETRSSMLDTILEVALPRSLAPGERMRVALDFNGVLSRDFGGANGNGYGIFNLSDGVLAMAGWYPILAAYDQQGWNLDPVMPVGDPVYSETALYTVDVTAGSELVLATTGVEVSRLDQEGKTTHRYAGGPARDFFIVASPDYQSLQVNADGTTVRSLYLPGYEAGAQTALDLTVEALRIFNERFGPYPYSELEVAQAPMNRASGVEYPGIFLVRINLYNDMQDLGFLFTVVHEVAHQWWYSTVGNDVIEEPWLDEALATFSSGIYFEATRGPEFYAEVVKNWQESYDRLLTAGRDQPVIGSLGYFSGIDGGRDYPSVVYVKGALALHKLRERIGDQAFFQALQDYYRQHYFVIGNTADLLSSFEQASGQELDGFYQEWLYSAGPPPTEQPSPTITPVPTEPPTVTPEPSPTLQPTPTTPPPVSFAVIGDYGIDNQAEEDVANLVSSWDVSFIITTGDNNYYLGEWETIDRNIGKYYHDYIFPYNGQYGEGAGYIRFFPTLGNHDLLTDDGQPYFEYFNLPGNERYYDFVWGPVHFFALNSNDSEPRGVGASSEQASWLQSELAASTSPWQVVYAHYPPYSSGIHGSTDWLRWPYKEWGADVMIAGHEHVYERLIIDDFPYIINGLGGMEIYYFLNIVDGSVVRYNDDYGAMLVHANAEQIIFQFITRSGEVIDYYVIDQSQ